MVLNCFVLVSILLRRTKMMTAITAWELISESWHNHVSIFWESAGW